MRGVDFKVPHCDSIIASLNPQTRFGILHYLYFVLNSIEISCEEEKNLSNATFYMCEVMCFVPSFSVAASLGLNEV